MRKLVASLIIMTLLVACGGGGGGGGDFARDVEGADLWEGEEGDDYPPYPLPAYAPESANNDQLLALERANYYRWLCGLPALSMLEPINQAAQAHSEFYANNVSSYQSSGLSPHNENSAWPGFTGDAPWDRMGHFGYAAGASEVIAFIRNPEAAVDGWMNTLYHRIPFMDASMVACGYGNAGSGTWQNSSKIDTMDFGSKDENNQPYSGPELEGIYPPPGATGIPPSFDGLESPEPIPPPTGWPSGTIVTVTWSSPAGFKADVHEIWEEGSNENLPHVWATSANDPNIGGTIALYTNEPLKKGTTYWVHIKGTKNGMPWEREWSFTTQRY